MTEKKITRVGKYVDAIKGGQFVIGFVLGLCIMFFSGKSFLSWSTTAPAIDFQQLELLDLEGKAQSFNQADSGYRLVYFWASWHKRCAKDLPKLVAACKEFKQYGCDCIAISDENPKVIEPIHATFKESLSFLQSPRALRELGLKGIPSYYLLSPKNEILDSKTGIAHWEKASQVQKIKDFIQ